MMVSTVLSAMDICKLLNLRIDRYHPLRLVGLAADLQLCMYPSFIGTILRRVQLGLSPYSTLR